MSDQTPFFLTGANAKILLNNKTVAFATDVSYRISVNHATPRVLGRYEVETIQPLSYEVSGSLTIIRYGRGISDIYKEHAPSDVSSHGSGIGSYGLASFGGIMGSALGLPTSDGQFDGVPNEAFDPSRLFQSKMFNIEIRQKLATPQAVGRSWKPKSINEFSSKFVAEVAEDVNNKLIRDVTTPNKNETSVILLRDCRFDNMEFKLNKKSIATITLSFKARYVDDDTRVVRKSGVGQEFS